MFSVPLGVGHKYFAVLSGYLFPLMCSVPESSFCAEQYISHSNSLPRIFLYKEDRSQKFCYDRYTIPKARQTHDIAMRIDASLFMHLCITIWCYPSILGPREESSEKKLNCTWDIYMRFWSLRFSKSTYEAPDLKTQPVTKEGTPLYVLTGSDFKSLRPCRAGSRERENPVG